jgi:RAD51-like protein 3
VIDTITPLLGPLLSAVSAQGHAIMIDFMRQLQAFAQTLAITVIVSTAINVNWSLNANWKLKVINGTASQGPDTFARKPALGPSFALMTDTTLWLQAKLDNDHTDAPPSYFLTILRSRSVVCTFHECLYEYI